MTWNKWIEEIDEILGFPEPRYLTYVDAYGRTHVEVEQISHFTTFVLQDGKLVPSFDSEEAILLPIEGITSEL